MARRGAQQAIVLMCISAINIAGFVRSQKSGLQCENQYCRALGHLGMDSETYPYTVPSDADFQLVVTLRSTQGDVDLAVTSPHGKTVRRSSAKAKDSRKDFVVFSQSELREDPGVYEVTVISRANVESDYILDIQEAAVLTIPQLHEDDEVVLQKVFDECCEEEGACPTLQKALVSRDQVMCSASPNRCDDDGHLIHLSLGSEGLDCKFPRALADMRSLTRLDLTFNQLDGSLEDDVMPVLGQLYDLEHLSLGFNKLDGELTCGVLGPDKKLHELDLAHNRVEGSIPQCLLGSRVLQELYLANNELTGSLPGVTEGSRLTVLSVFDQKDKGLSGEIRSFSSALELSVLRLDGNSFSGKLPDLPPSIQEVRLQCNKIHGSVPEGYGELPHLHTLKAESNKLSGSIPTDLAEAQELQILDLSLNRLTGSIPSSWDGPRLVEVDLHGNALSGGVPASLAELPRLSYLQLQDNKLTGDLSAYAAALSRLQLPSSTRFLSVGGNQLTGEVPPELQKLGAFLPGSWNILDNLLFEKTLNVSHNELTGELPAWALHSKSADEGLTVRLEGNKWTCPGADAIAVCQNLDEAQLGNLTCADRTGLANSATSRHAVLDMLSITQGSDCPALEDGRRSITFGVKENGHMLPGFTAPFTVEDEGTPLEDFSGGDIWDAAWGESDFEDAKGLAAWALPQGGQAQERAELREGEGGKPQKEGILQLPEEQALKEREQEQQTPVGDVDLPDWAPGHRVKSSGHRGDVDVPDWAPGHPSSRMGAHPSSQQERGQGYQRNQDVSPPPDARHDMAARRHEATGDASSPAAYQHDVDHRQSPQQDISLHLPQGGPVLTAVQSSNEASQKERPHAAVHRSGPLVLSALVVLLGLVGVGCGVAIWRRYQQQQQQQQGAQYEGLAMEAGRAGLELQKSGSGSGEGRGGDGDVLLPGRKAAVISLSAKAGGDVPADITAYTPPHLEG